MYNQRFDFDDKQSFIKSFSKYLDSLENEQLGLSFNLIELKDSCETDFHQILKNDQEEDFIESNTEEAWCFINFVNKNQTENPDKLYFLLSQSLIRSINDINRK